MRSDLVIQVKKDDLLAIVQANLAKHIADFEETLQKYAKAAQAAFMQRHDEMQKILDHDDQSLRAGSHWPPTTYFSIRTPQCYAREYEEAIDMLKMACNEIIELDDDQFRCYVKDNWQWKSDYNQTKMSYGG